MNDSGSTTTATDTSKGDDKAKDRALTVKVAVFMGIITVLRLAVWLGGIALIVYVGVALPMKYTAGQETTIQVLVRMAGMLRLHVLVPAAAVAVFLGLWRRERRVGMAAVAREHKRVEELEKKLDPRRTSSGLEE